VPSLEENKELTRRFNDEVFNKRNLKYAEDSLSNDFVEHNPFPGFGNDKAGAMDTLKALLAASDDLRFEEIQMIAEGDRVAIHSRSTATDTGGFMPGIPATNKPYSMEAMDIVVLGDDGRFTEHYGLYDVAGVLMQLGLMPGGGASSPGR
jgi:predicted SnoaL-like aldol condensation-catalyzing enzyme